MTFPPGIELHLEHPVPSFENRPTMISNRAAGCRNAALPCPRGPPRGLKPAAQVVVKLLKRSLVQSTLPRLPHPGHGWIAKLRAYKGS